MSNEQQENRIAALTRQAADARSRLTEDIEALAYKVSPENLKQEALEVTEQVTLEVKGAVTKWGRQAKALAHEYSLVATVAVGFSALLYAAAIRRNRTLIFGALAGGVGALALAFGATRRRALTPAAANPSLPYRGDALVIADPDAS